MGSLRSFFTKLGVLVALTTHFVAGESAIAQPWLNSCSSPASLKKGLVMYVYGRSPDISSQKLNEIADNFDFLISGNDADISKFETIKARNPNFKAYGYISLSDSYNTGERENFLATYLNANGGNIEDAYLHFCTDTVVTLYNGNTPVDVTIKGYGCAGGTATTLRESRVAVYYGNLTRNATHFGTALARNAEKAYALTLVSNSLANHPNFFWDGIFYDNAFYTQSLLENVTVKSGGQIREHPTHAILKSLDFANWHWFQGMGQYLTELRAYFSSNLIGGRSIKLVPNIANLPNDRLQWINAYTSTTSGMRAGDILFREYDSSPARNTGLDEINESYLKNLAAVNNGVSVMETGYLSTSIGIDVPNGTTPPTYTKVYESISEVEAIENNVAWDYVSIASNAALGAYKYQEFDPTWELDTHPHDLDLNLHPLTKINLGQPIGAPYILQQGTDSRGQSYKVWARNFPCGLAIVRTRSWDGHVDATSAVNVNLGGSFYTIDPSTGASSGVPISSLSLKGAQGRILLASGAPPAPDTSAPSAISNLSSTGSTSSSISLSWTASGDDASSGIATAYEIRYSTSPINSSNFSSATLVSSAPTPTIAGTTQSTIVTGLLPNTNYYFAIKVADEVPNWSGVSNILSVSTSPPSSDATAPAAITNLSAGSATASSLVLSWTATGDDGSTGTASSYDLRFSTSPITSANFSTSIQVSGMPAPLVAGTAQSKTVTGLTGGTTYFFALKTSDEAPNTSAISNVASATTLAGAGGGDTPPATTTDLRVTSSTTNSVILSWTAPGEDGNTGGAAFAYDFRQSNFAITSQNFNSATEMSEPSPGSPGTTQTLTVNGLIPGTTYYWAFNTRDHTNNFSQISNVVSITMPGGTDEVAPAAPGGLSIR